MSHFFSKYTCCIDRIGKDTVSIGYDATILIIVMSDNWKNHGIANQRQLGKKRE